MMEFTDKLKHYIEASKEAIEEEQGQIKQKVQNTAMQFVEKPQPHYSLTIMLPIAHHWKGATMTDEGLTEAEGELFLRFFYAEMAQVIMDEAYLKIGDIFDLVPYAPLFQNAQHVVKQIQEKFGDFAISARFGEHAQHLPSEAEFFAKNDLTPDSTLTLDMVRTAKTPKIQAVISVLVMVKPENTNAPIDLALLTLLAKETPAVGDQPKTSEVLEYLATENVPGDEDYEN